MDKLTYKILDSIRKIDRSDWDSIFTELLQGYDFYRAVEESNLEGFSFYYILIYEEGKLVPKDLFKAQLLYSAAAQHGSQAALERLSAMKGWPKPNTKENEGVPGLQPLGPGPISPKSHP